MRLDDLTNSFARDLRIMGKSPETVRAYTIGVQAFRSWLALETLTDPTTEDLTRRHVQDWVAVLTQNHAPATVRLRAAGVRAFCSWLVEEGELPPPNPASRIRLPPAPAPDAPLLTDAQVRALLDTTAGKTFLDLRDRALFRTMLSTGLRLSEAAGVHLAHVNLDQQSLWVERGKGGRGRMTYFGDKATRELDRYLRARSRHRYARLPNLWVGKLGALTPTAIRIVYRRRGEQAGIHGLHAHLMRHLWAHRFRLEGGDGRDLMRLAGWRSESMLDVYGAAGADERAREAARKIHPADRY